MKTLHLVLLAALLAFAPVFSGCKTTGNPQAIAYRSLASTQVAVDKAMKVYGIACVTGKASPTQQAQIDAAHAQYRQAFRLAVSVARSDLTTTPPDVAALADQLTVLIYRL